MRGHGAPRPLFLWGDPELYQALYRKWRPRTFDDVVGQGHITETLKRQVAAGRLSHAYLFTGTRGTGKTTCAKILARAVNCLQPENGNPCNRCSACTGIESGSILDVLELDAASNNGVDQVRALRDEAVYTPAAVRKRVYIVDEVHMLSTAAFNALLKILEEPPEHLMFILATTELHKVPATIRSRCQQFSFKRILPGEIAGRLSQVADREGIQLTGEGSALIARLADGGLRDALSMLDQCAVTGGPIDEQQVLDALGLAGNLETARLMGHLAGRDAPSALSDLARLYQGGREVSAILGELSALSRDLLVRKTAPDAGSALLTGGFDEQTMRELSGRLTAQQLAWMLSLLQKTLSELARSNNRRTDAELCLIRLCDETLDDSPEGMNARLARVEAQLAGGVAYAPASAKRESKKMENESRPPEPEPKQTESSATAEELPPWEEPTCLSPKAAAPSQPPESKPDAVPRAPKEKPVAVPERPGEGVLWPALAAGLRGRVERSAYSFLKNSDMVSGTYEDGLLTLWTEDALVAGAVGKRAVTEIIEAEAATRCGCPVRVAVKVGKPTTAPAAESPAEKAGPAKQDKLGELAAFGSQFENITVR